MGAFLEYGIIFVLKSFLEGKFLELLYVLFAFLYGDIDNMSCNFII